MEIAITLLIFILCFTFTNSYFYTVNKNRTVVNITEGHPFYFASVRQPSPYNVREVGGHICSATIITTTAAITAAQCFYKTDSYLGNKLSYVVISGNEYGEVIHFTNKKNIIFHPNYQLLSLRNNIAMITLAHPLSNKWVKNINIRYPDDEFPSGFVCSFYTWSDRNGKINDKSELTIVNVTIVDWETCRTVYEEEYKYPLYYNQICGQCDKGTYCRSNYGSPLICNGTLYGLAAWIPNDCNDGEMPALFINLYDTNINSFIRYAASSPHLTPSTLVFLALSFTFLLALNSYQVSFVS